MLNKKIDTLPLHISNTKFRVSSENQITLINPTQIIGVTAHQENKLILEDFSTNETIQIDSLKTKVNALVFLRKNDKNILIVGDSLGFVFKYEFVSSDKQWKKVKEYENLEIGAICCSFRFLHLVFFGGDDHSVKELDLAKNLLVPGIIKV